jgi:uncharacterized protein (TIGR03083 family)
MTTTIHPGTPQSTGHRSAMAFAEAESDRLIQLIARMEDRDWSKPTDCAGWDVKALLSHVLGAMEGNARLRAFAGQFRAATKASKRSGRPMIDELTALQVADHAALTPDELADRLRSTAAAAVRGRRRIPSVMRAVPMKPGPPIEGSWTFGYLVDTIMNRDYWMHRVDLSRAIGAELVLTADHDGRIVGEVVEEWARTHGRPFALVLEGPAGGVFGQGVDGESITMDAVEFCRTLSGRATGAGLLEQEVPF